MLDHICSGSGILPCKCRVRSILMDHSYIQNEAGWKGPQWIIWPMLSNRIASRQFLNISSEGDSTASLGKHFQGLVTHSKVVLPHFSSSFSGENAPENFWFLLFCLLLSTTEKSLGPSSDSSHQTLTDIDDFPSQSSLLEIEQPQISHKRDAPVP